MNGALYQDAAFMRCDLIHTATCSLKARAWCVRVTGEGRQPAPELLHGGSGQRRLPKRECSARDQMGVARGPITAPSAVIPSCRLARPYTVRIALPAGACIARCVGTASHSAECDQVANESQVVGYKGRRNRETFHGIGITSKKCVQSCSQQCV